MTALKVILLTLAFLYIADQFHFGTNQKCPDYQGVLIFQVSLDVLKGYFETEINVRASSLCVYDCTLVKTFLTTYFPLHLSCSGVTDLNCDYCLRMDHIHQ